MSKINSEKINFGNCVLIELPKKSLREEASAGGQNELDTVEQNIIKETTLKAEAEAKRIIEAAKAEAQSILQDTQEELDNLKARIDALRDVARLKGEQEGFQRGYEDGGAQINYELAEKIKATELLAGANFDIKSKILKSAQKDVVSLCIEICRKICHKTLNRETVLKIVERAFTLLESKEKVNIIVSPHIAELLGDKLDGIENLKVLVNPKIAQDAIIVEALCERVDCSITSQINEIANAFEAELNKTQIEREDERKDEHDDEQD